jgi:glutathione S-transferase
MKLYDSPFAPNPRRVRIFLAEKGIEIPKVFVDLAKMQHKEAAYEAVNPLRCIPALELDDGTVLTESIAICRYLDELHPEPPLFGTDALSRAQIEMWQRRLEFGLLGTVGAAFRHAHPAMKEMEAPQIPTWSEVNKGRALDFLRFLDRHLADQPFVCGETFTVADITGLIALDFTKPARIAVPDELGHVRRWHRTLAERPSAAA